MIAAFAVVECATEQEWRDQRLHGIGASESAAIFGVSPWESPLSLWARKRALLAQSSEESEAMEWGKRLEPVVAEKYREATGRVLIDPGRTTLLKSIAHPWMLATLDRIIAGDPRGRGVLEIKTTDWRMAEEWAQGVPLPYQIQVQHQLAVTGYGWASVAVLIGGNRFGWVDVPRDDAFIALLLRRTGEFWQHVVTGREPDIDAHARTAEAIKALHPKDNGTTIRLDDEFTRIDAEREALAEEIKRLEKQKDELDNRLKAAIGDATFAELPTGVSFSLKTIERKEYMAKASTFRQLRRIEKKARTA